jgi:xanthine dehydrogenase accessory factor
MNTIAQTICSLLENGETFVLATIISHSGSTPRTSGTKMIVTAAGHGIGTIGGGLMEAEVMSRSAELIRLGHSVVMPFDMRDATVATMDMICGGQAEVLLDCVAPTDSNKVIFRRWQQLQMAGGKECLLTLVLMANGRIAKVEHALATARGEIEGNLPLSDLEREKIAVAAASSHITTMATEGGFIVVEPSGRICNAYLYGAGHVARATAAMATRVGFSVSVADDREEYANRQRFPGIHEIRVLENFSNVFSGLSLGEDDFVVIFTRGHLHDRVVLTQALGTNAGYIGMIGSRKKIKLSKVLTWTAVAGATTLAGYLVASVTSPKSEKQNSKQNTDVQMEW